MYLINKDDTEHTGQVGVRRTGLFIRSAYSTSSFHILLPLIFCPCRNPMCGKCTKSDAGTSSQPVTVSESNTRISSARFPSPVHL